MLCCLCGLWVAPGAGAAEPSPELQAQWYSDGLYLQAKVPLVLSTTVEEALYKGVPMHFAWRAEVSRTRWYWWDKPISEQVRVLRVVYQPLTRRWRVGVSSQLPSETPTAVTLQQTVDSLAEVLALVARVGHWRVADASTGDNGKACRLTLRFALESGLLTKPFQMGGGDAGMVFEFTQMVPAMALAPPLAAAAE